MGKKKKRLGTAIVLGLSLAIAAPISAQSLWVETNDSRYGIFADDIARDVGDILTVVISESTTLSASKSTSNEKDGETSLSAGTGIFSFLAAATASGSDSFSAKGTASDTTTTTANITVTVIDVLPNGNLVIEGTQSIWQNKDEHKITLHGIVRPKDVTYANTVPSTKVADAYVKFDGKGPLNAKQRQGILTQIFNFLF